MLSPTELETVCQAYGVVVGTLTPISARVSRMVSDVDDLAIKFFMPGEDTMARTEAALLTCVNAAPSPHYRVQTLLLTRSGDPLLDVDGLRVLVTRFQRGTQKRYGEIEIDEWHSLGKALAALHTSLDAIAIPLPSLKDHLAKLDVVGELERLQQDQAAAEARDDGGVFLDFFSDRAALLRERGPRCLSRLYEIESWEPIHNDYNENNYLFVDDMPPFILDWDRALLAPREYDVVRCLNHLPLEAPERAKAFLQGYRSLRALSPKLLKWSVDAALVSHGVKHWPVERWLADEPGAHAWLIAVAKMVRELVRRRRELDAFFAAAPS
ncbi:MAG: phosphotransferase [Deltaproteobacteria bacterium]|nr:phosphotransferase [Deltaproteobacteria bacterium]